MMGLWAERLAFGAGALADIPMASGMLRIAFSYVQKSR